MEVAGIAELLGLQAAMLEAASRHSADASTLLVFMIAAYVMPRTVLALSAAPAPAASSSGGQTYVDNFCEDRGVFQVCRDGRAEYNVVQTPSGNTMYEINAKYVYTTTVNGVFYYSVEGSDHYQDLFMKGEPQENNYRSSLTYTRDGQTCTSLYHYHFANGQVQFYNDDSDCVPA